MKLRRAGLGLLGLIGALLLLGSGAGAAAIGVVYQPDRAGLEFETGLDRISTAVFGVSAVQAGAFEGIEASIGLRSYADRALRGLWVGFNIVAWSGKVDAAAASGFGLGGGVGYTLSISERLGVSARWEGAAVQGSLCSSSCQSWDSGAAGLGVSMHYRW